MGDVLAEEGKRFRAESRVELRAAGTPPEQLGEETWKNYLEKVDA